MGKIGSTYVINLRLVDTAQANTVNTISLESPYTEDVLISKIKEAGLKLLNEKAPTTSASSSPPVVITRNQPPGKPVVTRQTAATYSPAPTRTSTYNRNPSYLMTCFSALVAMVWFYWLLSDAGQSDSSS